MNAKMVKRPNVKSLALLSDRAPGGYKMVEVYRSVKGEGINTGLPMTFVRFAHCNLDCAFCDTLYDEVTYPATLDELLQSIKSCDTRWIVFTGGEPTLQMDLPLVTRLKDMGKTLAIETNGTLYVGACECLDYVTISPKLGHEVAEGWRFHPRRVDAVRYVVTSADSTIWPVGISPKTVEISPLFVGGRGNLTGSVKPDALEAAIRIVQSPPKDIVEADEWRLSIQLHKVIGVR